jgi:chaperonin GroEL (HSP60 family)
MSSHNHGVWRPIAENVEFNALESNSQAVMAVADTVRTTLGPKGLDKLLIDQAMNRHVSNDGVTILLSLKAIHPVARMIVEIAERQEQLVGDGTTTAVVMASEMIKEGKRLIKELGVHPTKVVEGIENGVKHACKILEKDAKKISIEDKELDQIINTSLSSKLDGATLSNLVIKSIRTVGKNSIYDNSFDFDKSIKVIRKINVSDTVFNGIVLERKRMDLEMPMRILKPKIMIVKLDLKPVKESWLKENSRYEEILNMENDRLLKSKRIVDEITATGANTLLISSPEIDEVIENFLVAKNIFATRISSEEIEFLSRYIGAKPVRMVEDLKNDGILGIADSIYEDEDTGLIYI